MSLLTASPATATPRRMGRKALGFVTTTVRLPQEMLDRIDAVTTGERGYQRGKFIREAIERELKRLEKAKA